MTVLTPKMSLTSQSPSTMQLVECIWGGVLWLSMIDRAAAVNAYTPTRCSALSTRQTGRHLNPAVYIQYCERKFHPEQTCCRFAHRDVDMIKTRGLPTVIQAVNYLYILRSYIYRKSWRPASKPIREDCYVQHCVYTSYIDGESP